MSEAVETLEGFGFSPATARLLVMAFSARETALGNLSSAKTSKKIIKSLGEYTQLMTRAMIGASLDPAIEADSKGDNHNIGDYEVMSGVVSTIMFELSYMVTMMADNNELASQSMHGILDTCLEEAGRVAAELKKIQTVVEDDGSSDGNKKPVVYN